MLEQLRELLAADGFMPHGHCYLWNPWLVGLHVVSDGLIAFAYLTIPVSLVYFIRHRRDVPFSAIFLAFGAFIVACGTTHAMEIWTLWRPDYLASGLVKAFTAAVSLGTAVMLARAMPKALSLPSPRQLRDAEDRLRLANESLEERVRERTAELQMAVDNLEQEIEDRRQAERGRAESEERLRLAVQATGLGFWERNLATGHAYVSPEWQSALGYAPGELGDGYDAWGDLIHPDDRARAEKTTADALSAGAPVFELETRLRGKDGRYHDLLSRASVVPQGASAPRLLGVSLDISERKLTEEALRRGAKDESLAVLAGGVAHDFNNLLVAMLGHASLAASKMPPENPARMHVEKVMGAAERAAELTRQMLAYSGKGHFEVRSLDLNRLIQENLHFFAAGVPKSVRLVPRLSPALPAIEADLGQIQQVVMNLVLNAAEAIGERGGQVVVRTELQELREDTGHYSRLTRVPLAPGRYVRLEVQDDGRGMDAVTLPRIFDPFFTTKFTGRGLGLAAVLGIVRGHQGGLSVYSEAGRGTTFKLLFPALDAAEAVLAPLPSDVAAGVGVVLLVDDEPLVRDAARAILESLGYEVLVATSGTEGVEIYRAERERIRCVLLDLSMPGLGGLETFKLLRGIDPAVSVVLCSGYNEVEATRAFVGHGLAGFVQKPYDTTILGEAIRRNLGPKKEAR
jgi:two-component system cell cycle sensor histidine kinase/response regulator CckA